MILPSTSWEQWEPLRSRSLQYARDSAVEISRKLGFRFTPEEMNSNFAMHERAFLNATAIAFGVTREIVDAGIQNGEVEWSINHKNPITPLSRCAGYTVNLPVNLRAHNEPFADWMAKITRYANL